MRNVKRLLFLGALLIGLFSFVVIEDTNAQSCGGPGIGSEIYVLLSNESGTIFCCCPGTMSCAAACCDWC